MKANNVIIGGLYRHFKGARILVITEAKHSETQEEMIVYIHLDNGTVWVRPKKMFLEKVERDGKKISRFRYVSGFKPGK